MKNRRELVEVLAACVSLIDATKKDFSSTLMETSMKNAAMIAFDDLKSRILACMEGLISEDDEDDSV